MNHVAIDDVDHEGHPAGVTTVRRALSGPLGTTDCAVVYYELAPGDAMSGGLHRHHDQEEVFYVVSGTATFDWRASVDAETETVTVAAGEAIRFPVGEFQNGYNDPEADERVVLLAIAAPKSHHDWDQVEWLTTCRSCEEETCYDLDVTDGVLTATCQQCGKELSTG